MKKLLYIITCLMLMTTSCEFFELDNLPGPDATVAGKFIDSKTGETVQMEYYQGALCGQLAVIEQGWDYEAIQYWLCKYDGTYRNDRIFAAEYRIESTRLNVFPFTSTLNLSKGDNNDVDFTVTPYCRIVNPQITYDAATKKIMATFTVEMGDDTKINVVPQVQFCASTDKFVGKYFNLVGGDPGAKKTNITPGTAVTLSIDTQLGANDPQFHYERDHYVRIAALAQGGGHNTNGLWNFSPIFKISSDFSTITEVEW
ncbi:MAG: DUF3823 domain-containing protein [Bacteroidales bacterium]|jgi:hypothetical protein